jgi:hypothetical protein
MVGMHLSEIRRLPGHDVDPSPLAPPDRKDDAVEGRRTRGIMAYVGLWVFATETQCPVTSVYTLSAQPVDATQALNLSAGVSNVKVLRGRSLS